MTYRITYTTDTHPTDLPDGATVEKVSALPVEIPDTNYEHSLTVRASASTDHTAYVQVDRTGRRLDRDQTVQVRDALNELLGETAPGWDGHSEPPADVVVVRDKDGDDWHRVADGDWSTVPSDRWGVAWRKESGVCPSDYAPFTVIRRK